MKFSTLLAVAGLAAGLGVAAPAMASNLLVNGDFENTGGTINPFPGTTGYYNVGALPGDYGGGPDHAIPGNFGWSVPVGNVDIVANNASYGTILPTGGQYVLDLVGYGDSGEISQSINTVLNRVYNVRFDYSENGGINGATAEVLAGGGVIGSVTGTHGWQTFTGSFIGNGGAETFAINEQIGGGNAGVFLDNVSVTAVPEPATWAMMAAGLALMGAALRTRKGAGVTAAV